LHGSVTESQTTAAHDVEDEVLATLRLAHEVGWSKNVDLTTDERFAALQRHERFASFLVKMNHRPRQSDDQPPSARADDAASLTN
jgi:hypothetical protein